MIEDYKPYSPVNCCIYCCKRVPDVVLTDEHIIAQGLQGNLVLPVASCAGKGSCSEITGRFEQFYMRDSQDTMRTTFGIFGKRRKKEQRSTVPVEWKNQAGSRVIQTDPWEYPFWAQYCIFGRAVMITGIPAKQVTDTKVTLFGNSKSLQKLTEKLADGSSMGDPSRHDPIYLIRVLAKVAHSFAVAQYGIRSFSPCLIEIICNDSVEVWKDTWHNYIGTVNEIGGVASPNLHDLWIEARSINGRFLIICTIRLFAFLKDSPTYEVVVGEHWNSLFSTRSAVIPQTSKKA